MKGGIPRRIHRRRVGAKFQTECDGLVDFLSAASQNGVAPTYVSRRRPTYVISGSFVMGARGSAPFASSFVASVKLSILLLGTSPGLMKPVPGLRVQAS